MSNSIESSSFEEPNWASFLLWDIDREFQNAHEVYAQWLTKNKRKRSAWECLARSNKEDLLEKSLRLGGQVQRTIEDGQRRFGQKFEKGDATCHTVLSAQLLRLQHEVCMPLLDCIHSRQSFTTSHDEVLRATRGVRRACLNALQDQIARLSSQDPAPFLPPPRFSVKFCPLALQLQKDQSSGHRSNVQARRLHSQDRYDDREICPFCNVHISVSTHSGLPQYRRILYQSHILPQKQRQDERATFACTSCYKTFDDSYAFLEHIFQKEVGSEKSCLKRYSTRFSLDATLLESNPALVEQCLKNCLKREMTRSAGTRKSKEILVA
ncbi:hypothetical protein N0V90_005537 [Kalmusia sp. IMI 367209]|nr:hypothetical protein N0V90_005537 [Kalmusia sp. IMI 367209]